MTRSFWRTAASNVLLAIAGVVIGFLLLEALLRIAGFQYTSFTVPDERLGRRLRPNAEGWWRSEGEAFVRINSAGFRDRERLFAKPPDVARVAVLGDSYMEALQVDLESSFHRLLEKRLNKCEPFPGKTVEVLNFGVSGYGTAQELLTFRYFASKYSPDVVLLAFFVGNDVRNNSRDLDPENAKPFFFIQDGALSEDNSFASSEEYLRRTNYLRSALEFLRPLRVVQAAYLIKDRLLAPAPPRGDGPAREAEAGLDDAVYAEPTTAHWRNAWLVTERLIEQTGAEVASEGGKLVLVTLSTGIQVHPDQETRERFVSERGIADLFYPDRRLEQAASKAGIGSIILGPRLQALAERDKAFLHGFPNTRMGTGHWNETEHRIAAEIVAAELCSSPSIATAR